MPSLESQEQRGGLAATGKLKAPCIRQQGDPRALVRDEKKNEIVPRVSTLLGSWVGGGGGAGGDDGKPQDGVAVAYQWICGDQSDGHLPFRDQVLCAAYFRVGFRV